MKVQIINKSNNQLPKYETPRSAGLDIRADFSRVSPQNNLRAYGDCEIIYKGDYHNTTMLRLDPGARALIPTGIFTSIPEGYEDGVLTAQEISVLDFSGLDLLVLSACQTGLGEIKGDGVFGLQRGFKKAGAQTIMMSLWKVDDVATQMLMTEFYKGLTSGLSKQEAFLNAQKTVRNSL